MFHPDIQAALAKERHNTMMAEAAATRLARQARQARQAGEIRRRRRAPGSPEVRRVGPVAGLLRNVCARLVRRGSNTLEYEIALVASEEQDRDRGALSQR
jgi:hypothetical protein